MSLARYRSGGRKGLGARLAQAFPERQILIRARGRVGYAVLSRSTQVAGLCGAVLFLGWGLFATAGYVNRGAEIQRMDAEIGVARHALRDARGELLHGRAAFDAVVGRIERDHDRLVALLNEEGIGETDRSADAASTPDPRTDSPVGIAAERRRNSPRLATVGDRLNDVRASQRDLLGRLSARIADSIDAAERTLSLIGLDPDALPEVVRDADRNGDSTGAGQGGPFIPAAGGGGSHVAALDRNFADLDGRIERWEELRQLLHRLPLGAPSDHYYVSSGFGKRRDPLNGHWAMHYGTDLAGRLGSPVLATAPGTVLFAGRNGRFGRLVEIDHGGGIVTRYGHLHRIMVEQGDKVDARSVIGSMGSSGRSTGVHVHYEVLVNGVPRNPENFMEAGKHVHEG